MIFGRLNFVRIGALADYQKDIYVCPKTSVLDLEGVDFIGQDLPKEILFLGWIIPKLCSTFYF